MYNRPIIEQKYCAKITSIKKMGYIRSSGFTDHKKIEWIHDNTEGG